MPPPKKVVMPEALAGGSLNVIDRTSPDDYPGFAAAEGNIYSCRYGIRLHPSDGFEPPKLAIFSYLLEQTYPEIAQREVTLHRFDVYYNHRLKALNSAGNLIGGGVGAAIASVGRVNSGVYVFEKLLIDEDPLTRRLPDENQVGCDGRGEGEYYASEISGGHDVVVTWISLDLDGERRHFKSYYQFQPTDDTEVAAGIAEALTMSIRAFAERLRAK